MRAPYVIPPAIALFAVFAIQSQTPQDQIIFHCGDAKTDCPADVDGGFVLLSDNKERSDIASGKSIDLGQMDGAFTQLMAFRQGWAPKFLKVQWKRGQDKQNIVLPARLPLPVRIWVICADPGAVNCSPDATQRMRLEDFIEQSNAMLNSERVGIELVPATGGLISDESATPGFEKVRHVQACGDVNDAASDLNKKLAKTVNMYLVSTYAGRSNMSCATVIAVVGSEAHWGTMLHEIGHLLRLDHVDGLTWHGDARQNIMYSKTDDTRSFFTEGQTFRSYMNAGSILNTYGIVTQASDERFCEQFSTQAEGSPSCPSLEERVWPDRVGN
jgi:hypothetical protein